MGGNPWLKGVASFLSGLRKSELKLPPTPESEAQLISLAKSRQEWAEQLLRSGPFQEAIQFMNEQILQDLAKTDPLDTDTLKLLRLRLEVTSQFPQVLEQFINEYETIVLIQQQQEADDANST